MSARRGRRQLAVTRAVTTTTISSKGCDGQLPLHLETADAAAAQAAIAALEAILSGATPLVDAGGAELDASLLCEMEYQTTLVYETVRTHSANDFVPIVPETAGAPSKDDGAASGASSGVSDTMLAGAVGGGVAAALVTVVLLTVGMNMRRLLSRSNGSWN